MSDYSKRNYSDSIKIIDEFNVKYKDFSVEQLEAMKFQYAYIFKILYDQGNELKNFDFNISCLNSSIERRKKVNE